MRVRQHKARHGFGEPLRRALFVSTPFKLVTELLRRALIEVLQLGPYAHREPTHGLPTTAGITDRKRLVGEVVVGVTDGYVRMVGRP
jgi:hypothetical protein